jgi:hypothetical protein
MDEITPIRDWLLSQKGHWTQIIENTGLSRKTLQRVVKVDGYNYTLETYRALDREMKRTSQAT